MLSSNNVMMETMKFVVILILYCVCTGTGYPSRPLNERSPDLTWQAWLLVDDQNQNKQQTNSDGMLRRRITPKSVFIAPTFSPESLPACADGYSSDPMGRCIKIIKLDQDAHYEFLIEKLKQKFSSLDYDDDDEIQPTTGPFQVNIPLNIDGGDDLRAEESDQETDVAIIVSPTMPDFDFKRLNLDKRDSFDDEMKQEMLLKKLAETTTRKYDEITTVTEESITPLNGEETTTTLTDPETLTTNTEPISTDEDDFSTTSETDIKSTTTDTAETTTEDLTSLATDPVTPELKLTTQSPKPEDIRAESETKLTTAHVKLELTTVSPKPEIAKPSFVRFPVEPKVQTLLNSYVKFPDSEVSYPTQIPSSLDHLTNIRDAGFRASVGQYRKQTDKPVVFREVANFDYSNGVQTATTARIDNRRNRDKHNSLFLLPPRWNPSTFQKPLVLRFSRKHAFVDTNQFKNPDYYRSIPSDDFAYLFKFKHKQQLNQR